MKILITGAHGFVGNRLMQDLDDTVAAPSMRGMSEEQIRNMIEKSRADVIIHTAAISDVGTCEKDPGASYEANVRLPLFLAKAAKEQKLICFSSDQVYRGCAGEGPYKEEDASPCNVYGRHKLEMEQRVLDVKPDAVMLRAEWMYDYPTKRSNYLRMLLNENSTGGSPIFVKLRKICRRFLCFREAFTILEVKRSRRCMISPVKCCTS